MVCNCTNINTSFISNFNCIIVFSFLSLKSNKFRDILDGKESVIISNGKLNFSEMKKQKYNLNDLLLQLRDKGIRTIEEVDYAILETNGKLSVFQKQDDNNNVFPLPLVLDGVIEENNLKFNVPIGNFIIMW